MVTKVVEKLKIKYGTKNLETQQPATATESCVAITTNKKDVTANHARKGDAQKIATTLVM